MWKTFKLKLAMYKWTIILVAFSALSLAFVWQYHRTSNLELEAKALIETNERLTKDVADVTGSFNDFKDSTDKALLDLETLRLEIAAINAETNELRRRLGRFTGRPPATDNASRAELEAEANAFTDQVFNEIQGATTGTVTDEN
jgi:hypothetical protein